MSNEEIKQAKDIQVVENDIKDLIQKDPELLEKIILDLQEDPKSRIAVKK